MTVEEETSPGAGGEEIAPGPTAVDITPSKDGGVLKEIVMEGTGEVTPSAGCKVKVNYTGRLLDGSVFDTSLDREPFEFNLGKHQVIKAWDLGVATMKLGEVARLFCREDYAYGKSGSPPKIPPNATLVFEITMISWEAEDLSSKKDKGILRYPIKPGKSSTTPNEGSTVDISVKGECGGAVFDERESLKFCLGEGCEEGLPPGVERALEKFQEGETSRLVIAPAYGFGSTGSPRFPAVGPNATLEYTITLNSFDKIKDSWMLDNKEKMDLGKTFKEKGTKYFLAEKYQLALKMYKKVLEYLESEAGFEEELEAERKSLALAGQLNTAMTYLKLSNWRLARSHCDKALALDPNSVKALFRRGQALLNQNEPDLAKLDFERVVELEPGNKAAATQVAACARKAKEMRGRERQIYANMFDKYTNKKEWRYGWWEEDKVKPEIVEDDPDLLKEKKLEREERKKWLEKQARLVKEMKEERERKKKEEEEEAKRKAEQEGEAGTGNSEGEVKKDMEEGEGSEASKKEAEDAAKIEKEPEEDPTEDEEPESPPKTDQKLAEKLKEITSGKDVKLPFISGGQSPKKQGTDKKLQETKTEPEKKPEVNEQMTAKKQAETQAGKSPKKEGTGLLGIKTEDIGKEQKAQGSKDVKQTSIIAEQIRKKEEYDRKQAEKKLQNRKRQEAQAGEQKQAAGKQPGVNPEPSASKEETNKKTADKKQDEVPAKGKKQEDIKKPEDTVQKTAGAVGQKAEEKAKQDKPKKEERNAAEKKRDQAAKQGETGIGTDSGKAKEDLKTDTNKKDVQAKPVGGKEKAQEINTQPQQQEKTKRSRRGKDKSKKNGGQNDNKPPTTRVI